MNWTDERVELLKKLWAEGLSASEIAAEIGGMSRNAVLGKAFRLNLATRKSTPKTGAPNRKLRPPRVRYILGQVRSKPKPPSQLTCLPVEISKNPVDFMGLNETNCHWPISGDSVPFMFCGDPVFGRSYCLHHFRAGYTMPKRLTDSRKEFITERFLLADKPASVPAPPLAPEEMVA